MGEIRIVGPGKTRGYPYPVCKKKYSMLKFAISGKVGIKVDADPTLSVTVYR